MILTKKQALKICEKCPHKRDIVGTDSPQFCQLAYRCTPHFEAQEALTRLEDIEPQLGLLSRICMRLTTIQLEVPFAMMRELHEIIRDKTEEKEQAQARCRELGLPSGQKV